MSDPKSFFRIFTERGPLVVSAVAGAMLLGIVGPASAQFFNFGFDRRPPPPRGGPPPQGGGFFSPFGDFPGAQQPPPQVVDSSRAPPPAKRATPAEKNVLVLGDAMADWLAYGLEDALAETPELGVIRKHKTISGLIKYQPKGEPADWVAAAKTIVASETPEVIVVMLGLQDRVAMREPVVEKKADPKPADKKGAKKDARGKADASKPSTEAAAPKPDDKPSENKSADAKPADDPEDDETPSIMAPERAPRSASGMYAFRDERWVELYSKKIGEMIAVLKTKGVPILWVGLPAVRGANATSDMLFLDSLYRDAAGKAGITYVDVWDGFVDEAGRFMQQGPDFEGQIRRLRSNDGVFFTRAGARKLAHYTEREIRRLLAARTSPVALPSELQAPETNIRPGVAGPRPLVGPMVPLVASTVGTDELLGGAGTRPASVDALAARTLVKGEPLSPPAGRADDFAWPRREVGTLDAPAGDPNVATMNPNGSIAKPAPKPIARPSGQGSLDPNRPPQPTQPGIFSPGAPQRPRAAPPNNAAPRPPGNVGPSASAPGFFTR